MGRHSLGDERVFWRSVVLFVAKWAIVAALPALAIWGVFRLANQPGEKPKEKVVATSSPTPTVSASASASPSETPSATPSATPSPTKSPTKGKLQVLNGSKTTGLALKAAERLQKDGYDVVNVAKAAGDYAKTTVYYQSGQKTLADQVARLLGATEVKPAPSNLSRSIPVTVVVGDDYRE